MVAHRVRIMWGYHGHPAAMRRRWNWSANLLPERPPAPGMRRRSHIRGQTGNLWDDLGDQVGKWVRTATVVQRDRPLWASVTRAESEVGS